jgi:hypothetical protein
VDEEPRTPLTRQQYEELLRYGDNRPHNFGERPNSNLIRRNLLTHTPGAASKGFYQITEFGRAVLVSESKSPEALEIDRLVQEILHRSIGWTESLKKLEEIARGNLEGK